MDLWVVFPLFDFGLLIQLLLRFVLMVVATATALVALVRSTVTLEPYLLLQQHVFSPSERQNRLKGLDHGPFSWVIRIHRGNYAFHRSRRPHHVSLAISLCWSSEHDKCPCYEEKQGGDC